MAQFRTTADIVDSILRRAGETTNGNSAFESDALEYLNRVHHTILAGGSIFNTDVDEAWVWAHSKSPIILELQPAYETGTVSVTNGSEAGSFSSAPTSSLEGWYIRVGSDSEVYRIRTHSAGGTAFELESAYVGDTAAAATHLTYKLEYELVPTHLTVDSTNNKIDFTESGSSEATATLTPGVYTPAQLATAIDTALEAAGSSYLDTTTSYDSVSRKFTIAANAGGATLSQTSVNSSTSLFSNGYTTARLAAQQFTTSSAITVSGLELKMSITTGTTGSFTVALRADAGGNVPASTDLAISDVIAVSSLNVGTGAGAIGDLAAVTIQFQDPVSLSASTNYFIVLRPVTTIASGNVLIGSTSALGSDGLVYKTSSDSGSTWGADTTSIALYRILFDARISLNFATGENAANSAAALLGFDDEDQSLATSHTGKYPIGAISRLIEPFRIHRDSVEDSQIMGIDKIRFEELCPVHKATEALPEVFCKTREDQDGRIWVRFDSYPSEVRRVEVSWIPVPRDLKDNAISRPAIPRKDLDVLEYGAAFYLLLDKEDSKADTYGNLAKQGLFSMQKRNRSELRKVDRNFGEITPRPDLDTSRRKLNYGYTAGD